MLNLRAAARPGLARAHARLANRAFVMRAAPLRVPRARHVQTAAPCASAAASGSAAATAGGVSDDPFPSRRVCTRGAAQDPQSTPNGSRGAFESCGYHMPVRRRSVGARLRILSLRAPPRSLRY